MATFKELLQECRDEFMPMLIGAIEGGHDLEWPGAYMLSEDFHVMIRSNFVLLPMKLILGRLLEVATEDEKMALQGEKAAKYIEGLKQWLIEYNRAMKAAAAEEVAAQPAATPAPSPAPVAAAAPAPAK